MTPRKEKTEKPQFKGYISNSLIVLFWIVGFIPLFAILYLRYIRVDDESLPSISMLENQEELLATTVFADDGITVLGKYWRVNRTSVEYKDISPYVVSALISTEDERFEEHSGIDLKALGRAVANMGTAGGASTITQQLAKLIFTLKDRTEKSDNDTISDHRQVAKMNKIERRLYEKVKENIIALRLENKYTKNEIITMYLNQFDFLFNAVGIWSASKVYFNKKPAELLPEEAATLVGMCKNPGLFNPYIFKNTDYRQRIAKNKGIELSAVSLEQINQEREKDSLRAIDRRNVVLYKWYENSKKDNPALTSKLTKHDYDSLKKLPIITDYQKVDFKEGVAPYFRESLRQKVKEILAEKTPNGAYKYHKSDGRPYNIYEDGLKIYTTINVDIQRHAEEALVRHLKTNIQEPFTKNNLRTKRFPFADKIDSKTVDQLMNSARKRSDRYHNMKRNGYDEKDIINSFDKPVSMRIFSWKGEIDTILTPNDSIRYYKNIMRGGLVSIEPQTGFIKAWVGGPNIKHFAYDHVAKGKRQVGSTIKPFIYSAGMQMGVITACQTTPDIAYCVDIQTGIREEDRKQWCPQNAGTKFSGNPTTFASGLAKSMNNITVAVMKGMGGTAGPQAVAKLMEALNIKLRKEDIVPAMCLGVMDLSLLELVGAQCAFVNEGVYIEPTSIMSIEDRYGNIIYDAQPFSKEAMDADLAYATLSLMKGVITSGTGTSLRGTWRDWGGITYPMAGKTGTTQNNSDGWFMGLTPELVTGVWVGAEDMAIRFRSMEWGQGARLALPIYGYMMQGVYKDSKIHISTGDFEEPPTYKTSKYNCTGTPDQNRNDRNNSFGI